MSKIVFGILVSMLMIGSVLTSATVVENDRYLKGGKNLFEIDDGEISVTIPIGNYEIKSTEQGDEIYVENFGSLLIPGKPNLPSKIFSIAIPPGAEFVDINFDVSDTIVLSGVYNVPPVNLPRVIGDEKQEVYTKDLKRYNENYNSVYGSNDPYPSSVVEFVKSAGYRKYNLVDVRVNPLTYYPLSGQLTYYPEITIQVSYAFPEGFSYEEIMVDNVAKTEQLAEKTIYNYDQAKKWYTSDDNGNRENYDYVIITLNSLTSKITSLVDWEEGKGKNVYVATTDWISSNYDGYDLAEKMRNFLRDKYPSESWGILYVCLIGDYEDVPMRRCAQSTGYGEPRTDFYFAELSKSDSESWDKNGNHQWGEDSDPIDFHAEINVGRIPWSDGTIVQSICEKSVAYEQNNDPTYKKNILLLGAFFWDDTDNAVLMEKKVDQDWMADWTMTRLYEDAQSNYPCDYDLTYANVKNVWSDGTFAFVDWAGHGSATACYELYPSQPFVDTQTCISLDDNYPAIVFADACSNSDTDYDNIGQMMMKQGAIGFLGATQVAYGMPGWNNPYSGSSQSLDYFFTTCCTSGDYTQGEAHQWALLEMYTNNLWYYTYYETFQWGALWGNPDLTMGVVSRPPETPSKPDGPGIWTIDIETTFSSSTTDPEGDGIYYLFDWGDGTESDWVGPYASGQTGEALHIWTKIGDYEVKVMAKDIYGVQSDWSEPATIAILENSPPGNPTIKGPKSGSSQRLINFAFSSTDPESHNLYYYVFWGDGNYVPWAGPYASGEEATLSHAWNTPGDYTIAVKVMDQYGAKSSQTSFKISITKNKAITNPILFQILKIFMDHFPILERLI